MYYKSLRRRRNKLRPF